MYFGFSVNTVFRREAHQYTEAAAVKLYNFFFGVGVRTTIEFVADADIFFSERRDYDEYLSFRYLLMLIPFGKKKCTDFCYFAFQQQHLHVISSCAADDVQCCHQKGSKLWQNTNNS